MSTEKNNKSLTVGVWVIACGVLLLLIYLFVPGVRARVENATEEAKVAQESAKIDEKAPEDLKLQVAMFSLSVMQYSQDYEDKLPPKSDYKKVLEPYTREDTERIFEPWRNPISGDESSPLVFSYTGPEKMPKNSEGNYRSDVELAYKEYSTGKCIVFVDGHTQWIPKKQ